MDRDSLVMMKGMRRALLLIPIFAFSLAQAQDLPEGKGKAEVDEVCSACHGLDLIISQHATKDGWSSIVDDMVTRGASAPADKLDLIVEYLATNFGKQPAKVNVNKATAKELETGLAITTKEAEAIAAYRKDHGDFKTFEDLTKVADVDRKKLDAKKDSITF